MSWLRRCRNPWCEEIFCLGRLSGFCLGCRLMGLSGVVVGLVLAWVVTVLTW